MPCSDLGGLVVRKGIRGVSLLHGGHVGLGSLSVEPMKESLDLDREAHETKIKDKTQRRKIK